jgi:hypothetical protein
MGSEGKKAMALAIQEEWGNRFFTHFLTIPYVGVEKLLTSETR